MKVISVNDLLQTHDCVAPGCPEATVNGLEHCRRHASIPQLRALRESSTNGLEALVAVDAGEPQTPDTAPDIEPDMSTFAMREVRVGTIEEAEVMEVSEVTGRAVLGEAPVPPATADASPSVRRTRANPWTREEAIAAVQAFHAEHGRVPLITDKGFPNRVKQMALFGSFSAMVEAAGFEFAALADHRDPEPVGGVPDLLDAGVGWHPVEDQNHCDTLHRGRT